MITDRFEKRKKISIYNSNAIATQMLKVLIEEVSILLGIYLTSLRTHQRVGSVLQKLGIPTEIATSIAGYYADPIEAMAHRDSDDTTIHIIPGINKLAYGAIASSNAEMEEGW
jgi:hypothetical protein